MLENGLLLSLFCLLIGNFASDTINSLSNGAPYWQEDNQLERCSYGTPPVYVEPDQMLVPLCFHSNHFKLIHHYLAIMTSSSRVCCRPCTQESVVYVDDQAGISGQCTPFFLLHFVANFHLLFQDNFQFPSARGIIN